MNPTRILAAILPAIMFAIPATAHHSHAMYDESTSITLEGTIVEFHWVNPHTWIYLEVEDENGVAQEWVIEGGGPGTLTRRGWSGTSFQPGERVTAIVHPIADGSTGAMLGTVTKESGEVFDGS